MKRLLSVLKSLKREIEAAKALPPDILKQTNALINRVEAETG